MQIEIWTAFAIGLLGSLHCIGMCGPIALALPQAAQSRTALVVSRLLYNIGRVITYVILGALCGFFGGIISSAGFQQGLSISMGLVIALGVLIPSCFTNHILSSGLTGRFLQAPMGLWRKLFASKGHASLFTIGLLNGLLPCGFVYIGLAAAASTGTVSHAALYMALFGLGTVPVMLVTSLVGKMISVNVRRRFLKLLPVGALVLAALLILRGLSLGIPYISPILKTNFTETEAPSCH
jgi:sulfite exporter TauE/SafE